MPAMSEREPISISPPPDRPRHAHQGNADLLTAALLRLRRSPSRDTLKNRSSPGRSTPLGILHETAEQTRLITPYAVGLAAFEAYLASSAQSGARLRTMIYGCTLAPFFDALIAAHRSGLRCG